MIEDNRDHLFVPLAAKWMASGMMLMIIRQDLNQVNMQQNLETWSVVAHW